MNINPQNETFRISDLYVTAFLLTRGCIIERVECSARKMFFHFADPKHCRQLQMEYMSGNDQVSARNFTGAIQNAKNLLNATKGDAV